MWRHIYVQADWRRSWTYGRAPNAIDISQGSLTCPSKLRHGTNLFIRWFRHTAPISRLLRHAKIRRTHSRLNSPGPHGVTLGEKIVPLHFSSPSNATCQVWFIGGFTSRSTIFQLYMWRLIRCASDLNDCFIEEQVVIVESLIKIRHDIYDWNIVNYDVKQPIYLTLPYICLLFLPRWRCTISVVFCILLSPSFAKRGTLNLIRLSVPLSVRHKNFHLAHTFWMY